MSSVRVRFAPSPTGKLHVGGLRTAFYNYLFARKHDGDFILRIEDTDQERSSEESEENIIQSLQWAGLEFDEGPHIDGGCGPYRQSERKDLYMSYAEKLIDKGFAYYAFDDKDVRYDNYSERRDEFKNSLNMEDSEVKRLVNEGDYVIRLKVPRDENINFSDMNKGEVSFHTSEIDDQILVKSDGWPTYHLANVVDDHFMGVSHVIRGDEWLSSTPKHVLMYEAFGWEIPKYTHLPLILSPDGGKFSKRDADKLDIPVHIEDFEDGGFEPEALLNYLFLLGRGGLDKEIMSMEKMIEKFDLSHIGSSGVSFDYDKLKWVNKKKIRSFSDDKFFKKVHPYVDWKGYKEKEHLWRVCSLLKEDVSFTHEVVEDHEYFFEDPDEYNPAHLDDYWGEEYIGILRESAKRLEKLNEFSVENIEEELRDLADDKNVGGGDVFHPVRIAVSGRATGPSVVHMVWALGRRKTVERLRSADDYFSTSN